MTDVVDERTDEATTTEGGRRIGAREIGWGLVALSILWVFASNGFEPKAWPVLTSMLITAGIYAIAAVGLNIHFGYTGLLNFGHVAFMALGAYVMVLLLPHQAGRLGQTTFEANWPLWAAVIAGLVAAALLGLLLGVPTLRLRGDYLAIVTIAVGEILRLFLRSYESVTGGVFGVLQFTDALQGLRPGWLPRFPRTTAANMWLLVVTWVTLLVVLLLIRRLIDSPWGRVLRAIREDEDAARALGKNVFWYKLQSLMIGGALGGLAGMLLAFAFAQVNPDTFLPQVTFFVWAIMILGGAATIVGPVAGSIIFWVFITQTDGLVRDVFSSLGLEVTGATTAGARFVVVGLLIMILMIFRPQGLFGKREELLLDIK